MSPLEHLMSWTTGYSCLARDWRSYLTRAEATYESPGALDVVDSRVVLIRLSGLAR